VDVGLALTSLQPSAKHPWFLKVDMGLAPPFSKVDVDMGLAPPFSKVDVDMGLDITSLQPSAKLWLHLFQRWMWI